MLEPIAARHRPIASLGAIFALIAGVPATSVGMPWTALHFSTGTSFNHTLAVGDLNGDGKLDVATPNSQASAVTVFLGLGDGTLAPFQAYATFSEPQDVQMADLTGDGVLDLATPDYSGGGATVLRGLGDGTFAARVGYPVGNGLVSLVAVDLDGDTRLDLVASRESNNTLAVLPALPQGGFGAAVPIATGATPHQITRGDFDHDGDPDLAVASHSAAAVSVHLGNGTTLPGGATPYGAGAAPIGITVADLNLDGDADLVVSNVNAATVSVLLGNGDGTFAAPVAYPTDPRPRGMDAGDLDGDGVPEVVIATGYPDGDSVLTVYRGVGDGTLVVLDHIELPYRAADCVIADMNADGHRDIVTTGPWAGVVSVLLNPGPGVDVPGPRSGTRGLELDIRPNPSRGPVDIALTLVAESPVDVGVFDVAGRRVATLAHGTLSSGPRMLHWDGRDAAGRDVAGLYFVRARGRDVDVTRRVLRIR